MEQGKDCFSEDDFADKCFTAQGHGVLEMPSGTGKTISLLSLIVAYQKVSFGVHVNDYLSCAEVIVLWSRQLIATVYEHKLAHHFLSHRLFLWK